MQVLTYAALLYTESQLLVLFADGALCGSTVSEKVLSTVWSVPVGTNLCRAWFVAPTLTSYMACFVALGCASRDKRTDICFRLHSRFRSNSWKQGEGHQPRNPGRGTPPFQRRGNHHCGQHILRRGYHLAPHRPKVPDLCKGTLLTNSFLLVLSLTGGSTCEQEWSRSGLANLTSSGSR